MQGVPKAERVARAKKASVAAVQAAQKRIDPYKNKYGADFTYALSLGASVKQRCTNPNNLSYVNYGGRGINFGFPSVRAFAEWLVDNLEPRPSPLHSIDRIDNNKGYTAGNLRWATAKEQNRNKRAYKRTKNGERIRLIKTQRPDLTYETIRLWISQCATNEEIIQRKKYARSSL